MKRITFLLVLLFVSFLTHAQSLVATLQHGNDISVYYGSDAFVQAHEAAVTGDIITLSSGTFNPTTITKAITLRGAGCCMDTITGIYPTVFENSITANVSDNENSLTIEGIYFNTSFYFGALNHPKFIKCYFKELRMDTGNADSFVQNAQFVNCMIFGYYLLDNHWCEDCVVDPDELILYAKDTQFTNCFVKINPYYCNLDTHISFANSVVQFTSNTSVGDILAVNSIFYYLRPNYFNYDAQHMNPAQSSSLFYNCIAVDSYEGYDYFQNQVNATNLTLHSFSEVFETYNAESGLLNEGFVLKDDFAASFLGNDGTEVGIHGGVAPYNPRPNYMVLKQCNVASQSTIDGKLSVEIQVVAEGE